MKAYKGQITFVNLIAVFVSFMLLFILLPIIEPFIESTVTYMAGSSNPYAAAIAAVLYLIPFSLILGLIITTFNYAIPQREGR